MKPGAGLPPPLNPVKSRAPSRPFSGIFAGWFGLLLGLSLVKFGNPLIMEKHVGSPTGFFEWLLDPWPVVIAYRILAAVTLAGVLAGRWRTAAPLALVAMPLVWLGWQALAATQTVDAPLTQATVFHFTTCVICFYLGLYPLSQARPLWPFWAGILAGFLMVLLSAFQQHFGGLEDTRRYFFLYVYPNRELIPPDLLKKMTSNRVFGTLFYPNTLAGVILILLPIALALIWTLREGFTAGARALLMTMTGGAALACLYWSGSKSGWLLMLGAGLIAAMFLPFRSRLKLILVGSVLVLGLAGFFWRYSVYFNRGATSVEARFDYWRAALQTVEERPVFGTGPGTFGVAYRKVKQPKSEMAKLAHNDYLQQASDSGVAGFLAYAGLVFGSLVYGFPRKGLKEGLIKPAVWLGLIGWAGQSLVEFGLYIPAVSWLTFSLMGWLLGRGPNEIDTRPATH